MVKRSDIPIEEILFAARRFTQANRASVGQGTVPTPDIALASKYPVKVIMARMEQLSGYPYNYLECGVSTRTSWLTDAGKTYLIDHGLATAAEMQDAPSDPLGTIAGIMRMIEGVARSAKWTVVSRT